MLHFVPSGNPAVPGSHTQPPRRQSSDPI